jgi:Flp pilus assembly protein TadD
MRERTIRRQKQRARKKDATDASGQSNSARYSVGFASLLVAGTLLLYSPLRSHAFLNYDDDDYVVNNAHVTTGLNWQNVRWALTSTEQSNWHPVTWLSHALDCQLFGFDAGDHHITSLLIHTMNALLLFLLLRKATGATGRSFVVAALFAWHPLNVQSVAWVAERKNLLSTLFFLLAIGAYGWYTRQPGWKRFAAVVGFFVLALASKPMAVTFPFALLLLDYWPLQRVRGWSEPSLGPSTPQQPIRRLLLEKLPLLALSAASSFITVWAQRSGGALRSFQNFPFSVRLENAALSYLIYIWKMFWPSGLSVFYPHPGNSLAIWKPAMAVLLLCAITTVAWRMRKRLPYLLVGWLWFLGTMLPIIGIVQVGDQAMADRYAYVPLVGLFVAIVWVANESLDLRGVPSVPRWVSAVVVLAILSLVTGQQLSYWEDGISIWSHAFEVTGGNLQVEKQLANAMVREGQTEAVVPHLRNIASRDPGDIPTRMNLGAYYASKGHIHDAISEFEAVAVLTGSKDVTAKDRPYRSPALLNLGFAYTLSRDYPNALKSFQEADQCNPQMVDQTVETLERSLATSPSENGYLKLSLLLQAEGQNSQASSLLEDAVKADPEDADTRQLLSYLAAAGK